MAPLPSNNAFGAGSPSWNLSFPTGNITAAEILAYLPHWLKSVDVIDRFVAHGGLSRHIAGMINEFRHQPGGSDAVFVPNSAQIMMSYAMRRAGYEGWTVGTHGRWPREHDRGEDDLSVDGFRTQRLTHPKQVTLKNLHDAERNKEAEPIPFKDLALHIKKHPSGDDALDLTRCVHYAVAHPKEKLFFPTDFERLVNQLGGPQKPSHFHSDREVFARRDKCHFPSPKPTPHDCSKTPSKTSRRRVVRVSHRGSKTALTTPTTGTTKKRTLEEMGDNQNGSKRRSGRLVGKVFNLREEIDDADVTDKDLADSPHSHYATPEKKRKVSYAAHTPSSPANDSDFVQHEDPDSDDDVAEPDLATDSDFAPRRGRVAARKARQKIETLRPAPKLPTPANPRPTFQPAVEPSAEMMQLARQYAFQQPIWLQPPVLAPHRLKVDADSIWLYAAEGCSSFEEMWASALSSTRFGGPRRSAPYRELYRLTDPHPMDMSDWAENIRWAKMQFTCFGSVTWTEYDYHLEVITQHRRAVMWVSEEIIRAGM